MEGHPVRIGLFPLNIVLFPDSSYPLHIFEERYKMLVNEVLETNGEFGINLIEDSTIRPVGCGASVSKVLTHYEDGRMDIIVTGTTRFTIDSISPTERPYSVAEITPFNDSDPKPEFGILEGTIRLYNQLIESVYGDAEDPLDPSDWLGGGASFRIAQKSGLELEARQNLLEMLTESERLHYLHIYLEELVPKIRQAEQLQSIIRNDGYTRP